MTITEGFAIFSFALNVTVLLVAGMIKYDIANLKVYMHEKFLTKVDFEHNAPCLNHKENRR